MLMKNAIILHGKPDAGDQEYYNPDFPSASNSHWLPWLQKQLMVHDIAAQTPEMPNSWSPDYEVWRKEFERYDITPQTILVGHSCGGGFIVRWLSEHPDMCVGKVVLVAPWLDPERRETTNFFQFAIDANLASRTAGLTIFASDNDMQDVQDSIKTLVDSLQDITVRQFHNYGHFCYNDLKTHKFPELLEAILNK